MANFQLDMLPQPNDETCGSTCLQAIYKYYDDYIDLDELIMEIPTLESGGTLAVVLGMHALERGYDATIYTYNLQVFDPTWFKEGIDLVAKLKEQMKVKTGQKLHWASQ